MKVVALISGGKDSCYAMMKCIEYGHEIVALANLLPIDDDVDELDSYMYQTMIKFLLSKLWSDIRLLSAMRNVWGCLYTEGDCKDPPGRYQKMNYKLTPGDEVEDLLVLLKEVKRQIPSVSAVSSGAIASDYQRLRVESVCSRLGLVSLAYLWKQDQSFLLKEMIGKGVIAILVKVAAIGLDPSKHLGKEIAHLQSYLENLNGLYRINVCGEGGEYESLTLDCPLFKFARIVLDKFDVVLHASNSICPVGVLHPLAFHLEFKDIASSYSLCENHCSAEMNSVQEVQGDCLLSVSQANDSVDFELSMKEMEGLRFRRSRSKMDGTFSFCCWLQDIHSTATGLDNALKCVLWKIESEMKEQGLGWENVIYIHLYISNMNEFAKANETYVSFITQEKCPLGVPSRSTLELPLSEASLCGAYVEVLASRNLTKRVLHVQSISRWAPSCIGPYSQATFHGGILYMAGQLGLDPPTMNLCKGGAAIELQQALANSEAVAECFNCSISTNAVIFVIYCSINIPYFERKGIQVQLETFLKQLKECQRDKPSFVLDPVTLYVLVPDLPKRALVEVKPVLYSSDDAAMEADEGVEPDIAQSNGSCSIHQSFWAFQHESWHDACIQKCVIVGKLCNAVLCITSDVVEKICQLYLSMGQHQILSITAELMAEVSKFCICLIDRVLVENLFSWKDVTYLRIYFPTSLAVSMDKLSLIFTNAFHERAQINPMFLSKDEPFFNLVPVLGCGATATSMDAVITCELLAQKF
ncbi:Diphthine--ammonia ligase-like protein [Drosera capensis]